MTLAYNIVIKRKCRVSKDFEEETIVKWDMDYIII